MDSRGAVAGAAARGTDVLDSSGSLMETQALTSVYKRGSGEAGGFRCRARLVKAMGGGLLLHGGWCAFSWRNMGGRKGRPCL